MVRKLREGPHTELHQEPRPPTEEGGKEPGSRAVGGVLLCLASLSAAFLGAAFLSACESTPAPASSFYEERIDPIVRTSCAQQTNGCHTDVAGNATGNLDLSSYDALMRREDVLAPYGPYPVGLLLLKGGDPVEVPVETWDPDPTTGQRVARVTTDIRHSAGSSIAQASRGYAELKRWIEAGYARTGVPDEELTTNLGACVNGVGHAHGFDPDVAPSDAASYEAFVRDVQPVLQESCAGGACHGNRFADLFLTCGDTEAERRWNYFVSLSHVTDPVSVSGLLRRPLATFRGGTFHEGGNVLGSTEDPRYQTLAAWATDVATRAPALLQDDDPDPGLRFFANRVQPVLVRKGCMFGGCHAPAMFHDLRLRGGDQGVFSRIATRRNYEMSREMLAVESPDPNASRLIGKNLFPSLEVTGADGVAHRGGSLFEDFSSDGTLNPATPDDCAGIDVDGGDLNDIPAYCVLVRWHAIEREEAAARGEITPVDAPLTGVAWVARPPGLGGIREFDTFRGGADLRFAPATLDADGAMTLEASRSMRPACGVSAGADIRTPAVSWDGRRLAFAARASASEPLRLYWMNVDGTNCEPVPGASDRAEQDGIRLHDFDPAFAPDGRLVFASTRGNIAGDDPAQRPTRTPAAMQPNANLYVLEDGSVRQLTFLLNQELAPNFMRDGRLIMTGEKREPGFHQLALRRQNLDGGDYHPLYAQRESLGFDSATEVVELPAANELAFIAAPLNAADGAGGLALVYRSIGPDQSGREEDRTYLHSLTLPAAGALGALAGIPSANAGTGAFRSPAALPSSRVLVSCDLAATDLTAGSFNYALCEVDVRRRQVREVGGESGMANVEAVAIYGRARHPIFLSRQDEANGASELDPSRAGALIHILDFPLLESLLFRNFRGPREIDPEVGGLRVFAAEPPPVGAQSFADVADSVQRDDFGDVFVRYREVGFVPTEADGSLRVRVPAGVPLLMQATDHGGRPLMFGADAIFSGERIQREQIQLYPGERLNQSFPRRFFNGLCGSCHGSISGRELDAAVLPDVLSSASRTLAAETDPVDLR